MSRIFFSNVFWIIWTHPEFSFPMYSGLSGHIQNFIFQCILDYLDTSRILFSNEFWIIWTCPEFYFLMYSGICGHVQKFIFQCILDYLDASRLLFSNDFWKFWTCPEFFLSMYFGKSGCVQIPNLDLIFSRVIPDMYYMHNKQNSHDWHGLYYLHDFCILH